MIFFKTTSNETIIRFNFWDIRNNQGLGKCHLRPIIVHPTITTTTTTTTTAVYFYYCIQLKEFARI